MTDISASPEPMPSRGYLAVIRSIDKFTELTGDLFVLLIIPLICANVIEVFARYVLKEPTICALDVTTMSYAALFMLGSALALLKGAHVRTDMLWEAFSDRTKGMIDSLAFLLFFLPTMVVLFFISIDDFFYSLSIDERASSGAWTPVLWPLRGVVPLTAFMLFLQGISELMKSLWGWRTGAFLTQHEEIERPEPPPVEEALGLIMLFGLVAVIFIGFPISFTLLFLALIFGGLGLGTDQTFNMAYLL